MKTNASIALTLCFALLCSSCLWSRETSFFSNFSVRQLIERSKAATGLTCDANSGGGGGGGIGVRTGGIGFGGSQFSSHKSDSVACRQSSAGRDFETQLFARLKLNVELALRDSGAQITESGSPNPASFYFAYTVKGVHGRVQVSGTQIGDYYDVHADLDESGN